MPTDRDEAMRVAHAYVSLGQLPIAGRTHARHAELLARALILARHALLHLTAEQVRWLHDALGDLVVELDAERASERTTGAGR